MDNINKPKHYELLEGVEVIDVIKATLGDSFKAFCRGNVIKYILRADKKNGTEDLKKAKVYLEWEIAEREKTNEDVAGYAVKKNGGYISSFGTIKGNAAYTTSDWLHAKTFGKDEAERIAKEIEGEIVNFYRNLD